MSHWFRKHRVRSTVHKSVDARCLGLEPLEDRRLLSAVSGDAAEQLEHDFGDAPAPYPTMLAMGGAYHVAAGPTLGSTRDVELDGQPTATADGDGADEDGVTFGTIMVGQLDASVTVDVQNTPVGANLDAWIDFNGDGNWGGPDEQIFDSTSVVNGDNELEFDVPSWTIDGNVHARFRLSTAGDLGIGGLAVDGEVEDYEVAIDPPAETSGVFGRQNLVGDVAQGVWDVSAADVDGDGDMDVLSASLQDDTIAWYENDGNARFSFHVVSSAADGANRVTTADVDGDGDLDVLSSSYYNDTIAWHENDGSQVFTDRVISSSVNGARGIFAADVDGDGDIDAISASTYDDTIAWHENDGDESFTAHVITLFADETSSVSAADVDGDGDIDVLSADPDDDQFTWYENDGSGGFTKYAVSTNAPGAESVFAADVDGDGDTDVLGALLPGHKIVWYENDGNQVFSAHDISTNANGAFDVTAADVNGDGHMDVLAALWLGGEKIVWYENDGNAGFTEHVVNTDADSDEFRSVFVADVDGDGDLDVLSAGDEDDKVAWYDNDGSFTLTSDFGDAPAPYPTLFSDDGPHHVATGPMLGASRDVETDGSPSSLATADSPEGDGVEFATVTVGEPGAIALVDVQNAPAGAMIDAWIDFDGDGNWDGPDEQIASSLAVVEGENAVEFDVPSEAIVGDTYARFRISTAGGLPVTGPSDDGEVEDYRVTISPLSQIIGSLRVDTTISGVTAVTGSVYVSPGVTLTIEPGAKLLF
jgi:hypothetical protein